MSLNPTVPIKVVESLVDHQHAMEDRIRARAYERFIQRGQEPGGEIEDWFVASADLIQSPRITVGQTETEFVVLFSVPDVDVKALELIATERAILLQSEPHPLAEVPGFIHLCECLPRRVFRMIELPSTFNPSAIRMDYDAGLLRVSLKLSGTISTPKVDKVERAGKAEKTTKLRKPRRSEGANATL